MTTRKYEGKKINVDGSEMTSDALTIEGALQINVNEKPFTMTMRTPGDDHALIRGLLHTEGVINNVSFSPVIQIEEKDQKNVVTCANVTVPENLLGEGHTNSRTLLSVSSCGICGKTELEDLSCKGEKIVKDILVDAETIDQMFLNMNDFQKTFHRSGGSHAAAAFDVNGNMLCCFEDIGRHNAVDKVIGDLIRKNAFPKASCLTVSGRISYEIVVKCFKAKIPILAAVSAPSSLSVDFAKELGITLLAFCRNGRATCYSNTQRIKNINLKNQAS